MKNLSPRHNRTWNKVSTINSVALISWVVLIFMFSAVFVSIVWETYLQSSEKKSHQVNNQTYVYPTFTLDFENKLQERKSMGESYSRPFKPAEVERRSGLSLNEFWDLYDTKWPVLITDVIPKWTGFKQWTKEYLNKTYGNARVVMKAVKGSLQDAEGLALPLHLFVKHIGESNKHYWTYITDELFITQRAELRTQIPNYIYSEENFFRLFPKEIKPWDCMLLWGTAYSRSMLHIDPYNWTGTNAVFWGLKKWKLFPPRQDHLLYIKPNAWCGFPLECIKYNSPIDTFGTEADLQKFPLYHSTQYIEVSQKPGELLIIPSGWFHQAYNSEETLAVSGQLMNRNNYRYILEEILKAGNLQRKQLPAGFHNLLPPDQVKIFMSLLPKNILKRGQALTKKYQSMIESSQGQK